MSKRVRMGLVVAMGLVTLGLIGLWRAEAEAQTCLQYRTIGGSSVCSRWSTKGVLLELTFKQDCGVGGENCSAFVTAAAEPGNSIAFCQVPGGGPITRRTCPTSVFFQGQTGPGVNQCDPKHSQDSTGTGGEGHDKGKHGCKATIVLERASCDACCNAGEVCLDVTPFEMETTVEATVGGGGGGEDLLATQQASASCSIGGEGGDSCVFGELCSINPKRVELNAIKPYQCALRCVGFDCFGDE